MCTFKCEKTITDIRIMNDPKPRQKDVIFKDTFLNIVFALRVTA